MVNSTFLSVSLLAAYRPHFTVSHEAPSDEENWFVLSQAFVFKSEIRLKSLKNSNSRSSSRRLAFGSNTSNFGFSGFLTVFLT